MYVFHCVLVFIYKYNMYIIYKHIYAYIWEVSVCIYVHVHEILLYIPLWYIVVYLCYYSIFSLIFCSLSANFASREVGWERNWQNKLTGFPFLLEILAKTNCSLEVLWKVPWKLYYWVSLSSGFNCVSYTCQTHLALLCWKIPSTGFIANILP